MSPSERAVLVNHQLPMLTKSRSSLRPLLIKQVAEARLANDLLQRRTRPPQAARAVSPPSSPEAPDKARAARARSIERPTG